MARNKIRNVSDTGSVISESSNFALSEAFKAIRTNLTFALPNELKCKKMLFTSAYPGEGKTTVSTNTAITIAQTDAKVLLIDADLRKPKIHTKFGIENRQGLSNVLSGMVKPEDVIIPSGRMNLWVMTAGVIPPNPAELLASDKMRDLLAMLETKFDYIIVDTSPINLVSDALDVSAMVNGVVLVIKYKSSTHIATKEALSKLEFVNANVIGIIMNNVTVAKDTYYKRKKGGKYGYSSAKYGYGYGYGYGYKAEHSKGKTTEEV